MGRFLKVLACYGFVLSLGGCGPAREARLEYQSSVEKFKACFSERGPAACETERVLMEADERKYNNIGAAVAGNTGSANVNIQRR